MEIKLVFDEETQKILLRLAKALEAQQGLPIEKQAKSITRDDIIKTAQNIIMGGGEQGIKEICKKYQVSKISLIPEEKYEDLMKDFEMIM